MIHECITGIYYMEGSDTNPIEWYGQAQAQLVADDNSTEECIEIEVASFLLKETLCNFNHVRRFIFFQRAT